MQDAAVNMRQDAVDLVTLRQGTCCMALSSSALPHNPANYHRREMPTLDLHKSNHPPSQDSIAATGPSLEARDLF